MNAPVRRREFVTLLGGAAAAWPLAAWAQQGAVPVIGTLYAVSAAYWADYMAAFRRGLAEIGFVEGRNVTVESRWADGQANRLPAVAADLVARRIAVMLVGGGSSADTRAVIESNRTTPIVFTTAGDPVANGLVASLNRPGGNATGVTMISSELGPKRLELLHEAIPAATRVAVLVTPNTLPATIQGVQAAARRLGMEIILLNGGTANEVETAFATAVQQRASAMFVDINAVIASRREQIATLALRHKLPTVSVSRDNVVAGQLMSYGPNQTDMYRLAGTYVGRILKGEKPADLPVQQPTRFELVVNLKTAKAIGLTIPETFLVRADEVIE